MPASRVKEIVCECNSAWVWNSVYCWDENSSTVVRFIYCSGTFRSHTHILIHVIWIWLGWTRTVWIWLWRRHEVVWWGRESGRERERERETWQWVEEGLAAIRLCCSSIYIPLHTPHKDATFSLFSITQQEAQLTRKVFWHYNLRNSKLVVSFR